MAKISNAKEPLMYKGRPLKPNVKIKMVEIDGEMKEVLDMPASCKNPYADSADEPAKKRTTKENPMRDSILGALLETLKEFSADGTVLKTKLGKYAITTQCGKHFSMAIVNNKEKQAGTAVIFEEEAE